MKEEIKKKSALEISIYQTLLEKEQLNVKILKKRLNSDEDYMK